MNSKSRKILLNLIDTIFFIPIAILFASYRKNSKTGEIIELLSISKNPKKILPIEPTIRSINLLFCSLLLHQLIFLKTRL